MENVLPIKKEFGDIPTANSLTENRLEALKSLASLLLREVESLTPLVLAGENQNKMEKITLSDEVQRFEETLIREALIHAKGKQRSAARILGTKISTLNAKIKRYGIDSYNLVGKL